MERRKEERREVERREAERREAENRKDEAQLEAVRRRWENEHGHKERAALASLKQALSQHATNQAYKKAWHKFGRVTHPDKTGGPADGAAFKKGQEIYERHCARREAEGREAERREPEQREAERGEAEQREEEAQREAERRRWEKEYGEAERREADRREAERRGGGRARCARRPEAGVITEKHKKGVRKSMDHI